MNEKVISEGEMIAAQMTSSHKRLYISARRVGRFGVLMGSSGKNIRRLSAEDAAMSEMTKTHLGPFYSLARYICYEAISKLKQAGEYRHQVKRHVKIWLEEMDKERKLMINPPKDCGKFFSIENVFSSVREMFRDDLTDEEYYEFWEYVGVAAFNDVHKIIYALQWKYEKALVARGATKAKAVSWLLTAYMVLKMYDMEYVELLNTFEKNFGYPEKMLRRYFRVFDATKLYGQWQRIMEYCYTDAEKLIIECLEERNVEIGLQDIMQRMSKECADLRYIRKATEENPEIFRSKKAWRDALAMMDSEIEETEKSFKEFKRSGKTVKEFFNARRDGKTKE